MKLLEEERRSFKEELTFSDSVWQPIRQSPHADIGGKLNKRRMPEGAQQ
jgi:hypothetical protein